MNVVETVEAFMKLMKANGVCVLNYSDEDFKIRLETEEAHKTPAPPMPMPMSMSMPMVPPAAGGEAQVQVQAQVQVPAAASGTLIKAPIVGTFYTAPSPEKPPFIAVGQRIKPGDVIYILESMKVMNEVKSEIEGVIKEILVDSGAAVEFDQPLIRVE